MNEWNIDKSKELYGIESWGHGYFSINGEGHAVATPLGHNGPQLDLYKLTHELKQRGIRTPMLIRLADITRRRVEILNQCFQSAIKEYGYKASYQAIYPIKVNQQRHLVEDLVRYGSNFGLGLECGSKPELLVVLAMMKSPNGIIICNGFKDPEYIETALLANKLGKHTIIVVDRQEELKLIIEAAKKFDIKPHIGFRVKLHTRGQGKWVDSTGDRSKFGLTATELVEGVKRLENEGMLDSLELLHFHIGSQIPSISRIKASLKEGARFYTELRKMGAPIRYLDVGGGLGIDYDGSGTSDSSMNYTIQEYANDVVSIIQATCEENKVSEPSIVTETGRAMVAHHSLLIYDVIGINRYELKEIPNVAADEHRMILELREIFEQINLKNLRESYHDTQHIKDSALQLFTYGILSLEQKAKIDAICWAIFSKIQDLGLQDSDFSDITDELQEQLSDTFFCNFSVFQSLPDSWAVGQLFPVMPLHRLQEKPSRRAVLVDLTCDSDGKIEKFGDASTGKPKTTLEVHRIQNDEEYLMGVFLVGAYQETLGDLHNLFGDTDAVHVSISEDGEYFVEDVVEGDTTAEVLSYFQYNRDELIRSVRQACEQGINKNSMTRKEAALLMKYYEQGLSGYTYLEEAEE